MSVTFQTINKYASNRKSIEVYLMTHGRLLYHPFKLETRYSLWRRTLSHNSLSCQIPSVSSEELVLPRLIRCELSQLRCHGHSLLLPSYLCRIKRKNSSCRACRHPLQDLTHLLLDCPAFEHLRRSSSAPLLTFLTSGPDLGAWPDCWVSVEFFYAPIPQKGSGSTTTTTN